jgi:hypothetical protein
LSAVKAALGNDFFWTQVDATEEFRPIELLYDFAVMDPIASRGRNASTLVAESSFKNQIVWVEGVGISIRSDWLDFLSEYESACRATPECERTSICLVLEGESALLVSPNAVGIHGVIWDGYASSVDAQLYAAHLIHHRYQHSLQQRIAVAIIATLSRWDSLCCDFLSQQALDDIVEPERVLKQLARERAWNGADCSSDMAWAKGYTHSFDGKQTASAALLAVRDVSKLDSLIWNAEVGVMLPFVEERRRELLKRYSNVLQVPYPSKFGSLITNKLDLEIGDIADQFRTVGTVSDNERNSAERLRKIRNHLSHLEPVPRSLLSATIGISSETAVSVR